MQTKPKLNHSLFIFGLTILLFVTTCLLVQAQTSQNDIVFQSARDSTPTVGNVEIYAMKADGSGQTNLTNSAELEQAPDWSPDGSRIVFVRSNNIWIMNADGSNKTQVTNSGALDFDPAWSPNGSKIAFASNRSGGNPDIYVMNADGSNPTRLTLDGTSGGRNLSPRWSPDSSKIVFSSIRSATGSDFEIYVMNADGSNQTALTDNTFSDGGPDWSPLGSKIAFSSNRDGGSEIYTMNTDGSLQTRITTNGAGSLASWSPDATKFVFVSSRDGSPQIYTMNADGSNQVRLTFTTGTAGPQDSRPRWNPRRTSTSSLLGNISTRLKVETGDNVLIGGFIVTGTQPKKVFLRGIGPSLPLSGVLADPLLELHNGSGELLEANDNWMDSPNKQAIIDSTIPPPNNLESAIVRGLPANNAAYTAILRGVSNGTGIGLVEAYDVDRSVDSKLANISTRGLVQTGNDVLIGGFIVLGDTSLKVIVRAIGPSLPVEGKLIDPTLELRDGNGALVRADDNWRSDQEAEIVATTIPPSNDQESALVQTLAPGNYTAIVRGVNGTSGVALVEVFALY